MNESILRELAEQIAKEQVLAQWPFYLIFLALVLVIGFGSALTGAYARRRGEHLATKADFDMLLDQLKATTAVAEEVRTSVSHADWATREYRTIRRLKLEELLITLHAVQEWQDVAKTHFVFGNANLPGPSPISKADAIVDLYFPELGIDKAAFVHTHSNMHLAMLAAQRDLFAEFNNPPAKAQRIDAFGAAWTPLYGDQLQQIATFKTKAREIMATTLGF